MSVNVPLFGVAGFPPAFFKSAHKKKRENIFTWLSELGLQWIELQNTYGVKMKDDQADLYRELAIEHNIGISLHAPYYITLASADDDVVKRSIERIMACFRLAERIGSSRIIFHPGHFPGDSIAARKEGILKIISGLTSIINEVPNGIFLYPETAGKKGQIGSLSEIIEICSEVSYALPCLDIAHIHSFQGGTLIDSKSIVEILNEVEDKLGRITLEQTHFHMYPVEIDHTGEKRHKAFHDVIENVQLAFFDDKTYDRYYPLAEDFIAAIKNKSMTPVVVCEARDSQDQGALLMKGMFENTPL